MDKIFKVKVIKTGDIVDAKYYKDLTESEVALSTLCEDTWDNFDIFIRWNSGKFGKYMYDSEVEIIKGGVLEMEKAKFKVGDIIKGTNCIYVFTDSEMTKGEVISIGDNNMRVKVLDHINKSLIGEIYTCINVQNHEFEIISEPLPFKVGDRVAGLSDRYRMTNSDMYEGEIVVIQSRNGSINTCIKVIKHKDKYYEGKEYRCFDIKDGEFKLIEENKLELNTEYGVMSEFISIGDITIAMPKGTPMGISIKHPDDEYSKEIGQAIAQLRMLDKAKEKGLI